MKILLDMDGVLADIESAVLEAWSQQHAGDALFTAGTRESFSFAFSDGDDKRPHEVREILQKDGFFLGLKPLPGALEAVAELRQLAEVYIVTSSGVDLPYGASDKYRWVEKYFDVEMLKRLIITPAKHMVKGDVLIDDKPHIAHASIAEWEHILFDQSYNRHISQKRRLNWKNWREILEL